MQGYKLAVIGMRHGLCIANPIYESHDEVIEEMNRIKKAVKKSVSLQHYWHEINTGLDGVSFVIDAGNLAEEGVSFAIEPVEITNSREEIL